jgi:RNA exonuclease 1
MVQKKYKLVSPVDNGVAGPCAFFASQAGCRNGYKCKFLHVLPGASPAVVYRDDSSSVVSSESESEVALPPAPAPTSPTPTAPSSHEQKKKNKNKKKRKSGDSCDGVNGDVDMFMKPKNQSASTEVTKAQSSNKKQKRALRDQASKAPTNSPPIASPHGSVGIFAAMANTPNSAKAPVVHPQPHRQSSKQAVADFRSLRLPIASFSIDGQTQAASPPTSHEEKMPPPVILPHLPLPNHTPTGIKWQNTVIKTREHVRYSGSFDFEKMKEADEEKGCSYATDWITARKFGPWCAGNPQAIAIDCEMCETRDPVTGSVNSKALCRVSIVNAENPDEVLLDTLVKPAWPVVDYRSRINGIKAEHLANVQFTLRHAQAFLMALCSDETVIIGHALHNDFAALKMEHHCNVDSSFLFPVLDAPNATPSLKGVALSVMKKVMPDTHDSVNDARTALICLRTYLSNEGKVDPILHTPSRAPTQLFVHRIPKKCQPTHLTSMFLAHTSVQAAEVDEIEFSGDTGTTHVTFPSRRHADLAFDTLEGKEEADKSGRLQKKVYLQGGGYVRVRKMVFPRLEKQESSNER